jgi:hypothetical protein
MLYKTHTTKRQNVESSPDVYRPIISLLGAIAY